MRSRITITISKDLLNQVDQTIDHHTTRNRSQAIESLLRQNLRPSITTAVILAGGKPTIHPGTNTKLPKPLIPINDIPLIDHLLGHLSANHIDNVIIATGPDSHQLIKDHVGNGSQHNLTVTYSKETSHLGTGGALKKALKFTNNKPFLLIHGDILTDINISEFINFFNQSKKTCTVAVKPRPGKLSYGRIYLEGHDVIDFQEPTDTAPVSLINTGLYIFSPSVKNLLPQKSKFKLESALIPKLVKNKELVGYVFQGIWFDVSDVEDWQEANTRWPAS